MSSKFSIIPINSLIASVYFCSPASAFLGALIDQSSFATVRLRLLISASRCKSRSSMSSNRASMAFMFPASAWVSRAWTLSGVSPMAGCSNSAPYAVMLRFSVWLWVSWSLLKSLGMFFRAAMALRGWLYHDIGQVLKILTLSVCLVTGRCDVA